LTGRQVEQAQRDAVVAFVQKWTVKVEWAVSKMLKQLGINRGKYYDWCLRRIFSKFHGSKTKQIG